MLEEKVKSGTITVAPHAPPSRKVVDLYEALKQSLRESEPRKKERAHARRKA